jgi:hypothetical protein
MCSRGGHNLRRIPTHESDHQLKLIEWMGIVKRLEAKRSDEIVDALQQIDLN